MAKNLITADSFGSDCPKNWEEIADWMNDLIEDGEDAEEVWDKYCSGQYPDAPEAITEKKYFIYSGNGNNDTMYGPFNTLEEAMKEGRVTWNAMTEYDKKNSTEFYIGYGYVRSIGKTVCDFVDGCYDHDILFQWK